MLKGERLDKPTYTVLQTMTDSGNTAICHKAFHDIFKQVVVQKTVSLLGLDDALAYSEPHLLKELKHKHLIDVWEAQWEPDPKWQPIKAVTFVMPYYEGGSVMNALLDGHRFSVGEAVGIACGLLDALHYLHVDKGLLHRDVKPANVMLDAVRRHPYLGDLGSAALMDADGTANVRSGTLLYQPPESHLGRYTPQGDLYSVGMVLLECLNGAFPYADLDRDKVGARLARGQPSVAARLLKPGPHVPPAVARLVARLVDRDPVRRPATALKAQRELHRALHLDWRERDDAEGRVWDGRWPPASRPGGGRAYEVRSARIVQGRYAGEVLLTARWRRTGAVDWRRFRSLERRAAPGDDAALGAFFRSVEAEAQRSAAA